MCKPNCQGELNFKELKAFNLAMLGKQGWRLIARRNAMIYPVYKSKYFRYSNFLKADMGSNPLWGWRSLLKGRKVLEKGVKWKIGRGRSVWIWEDPWIQNMPTLATITQHNPESQLIWVEQLITRNQ
ncbi:hypothetical protein AAHE18_12G121100 [Arachis hypogaea]